MNAYSSFFIGILGSFVVYFALYRDSRISLAIKRPKTHLRMLVFDILFFFICGGIVTIFLVQPITPKEAFLGGATWNGITGGIITHLQDNVDSLLKDRI